MREVIQELIETEAQAKAMVQAAREQAEQLILEAQKQAQGLVAPARAEARLQAEKMIESAENQARTEKRQSLEKAQIRIKESMQLAPETRDQIASAVVDLICGTARPPPGEEPRPEKL